MSSLYNWRILQHGELPLHPDGSESPQAEHRCTVSLIWPDEQAPTIDNTVMVDPCFTTAGYDHALGVLDALNISLRDVGRYLITHLHGDHMLHLPSGLTGTRLRALRPPVDTGLALELCPGHHDMLLALAFTDADQRAVWAVGDAILNEEWLRAWCYYWPNRYGMCDIVETWRSVAKVLSAADTVIPGHGPAFEVTPELVQHLIEAFPSARHSGQCPDVAERLRVRLQAWA